MTRRLISAAALALVLAPQTFAGGAWLKSMTAAQKAAKDKNQLILVDMFAEWCGWCHRFEREVFPSETFQNASSDLVLLRLNTEDRGEGSDLARKFSITSLPTFVLLAPDGSLAGMIRGYAPAPQFVQMLKETRDKYAVFQKRVGAEASLAKDYNGRLELAKEFLSRSSFDKSEPRFRKLMTEKGVPPNLRDEAYYQLAISYAMQQKFDDALKLVRELTTLSKTGDAVERARLLAGQIYLQQGKLQLAADEFRSFKRQYPKSPLVNNIDAVLPDLERRLSGQ
ncbi:MAG TPA: tetratricopeptide repeat protein [Thermoanaerobaculia bacterium]|nr:tetratricopeptide repeat protein [Thermoanaerobaculia bacterium]